MANSNSLILDVQKLFVKVEYINTIRYLFYSAN